jgi:hypothetical protein
VKSAGFSKALGWSLFAPRPAPSGSDMNAMNARHAKRNMPVYLQSPKGAKVQKGSGKGEFK